MEPFTVSAKGVGLMLRLFFGCVGYTLTREASCGSKPRSEDCIDTDNRAQHDDLSFPGSKQVRVVAALGELLLLMQEILHHPKFPIPQALQ